MDEIELDKLQNLFLAYQIWSFTILINFHNFFNQNNTIIF